MKGNETSVVKIIKRKLHFGLKIRNHNGGLVSGYCYGVVSYNASHAIATIFCYVPYLSCNHIRVIHQSSLLWLQQRHLVVGRSGREVTAKFYLSVSLSYLKGSLTCRKVLRHGANGYTSPPKEVVVQIFIALKNNRSRPGLNPRILDPMAAR
jgi:hypothetical protein